MFDDDFQLSDSMINDDDSSMWVQSDIQRLIKNLPSLSFGKANVLSRKYGRMLKLKGILQRIKLLALSHVTVRAYCRLMLKISV